ncbi:hypothetical protein LLE49_09105 [Alicyclobacillus tolerans]|uniref:hypothetical protein n=1 Tax=Alicyclobacillus tolerans TaxID=90970 RepID=UPI001F3F1BFD|nr:hypothetical protein [Alicyclobacillus tolerans]MCF8564875.1 hypothetical protein [Alicyclobacillus tolerans]
MDERFECLEKLMVVFLRGVSELKMELATLKSDFVELKSDIMTMKMLVSRVKVTVKN